MTSLPTCAPPVFRAPSPPPPPPTLFSYSVLCSLPPLQDARQNREGRGQLLHSTLSCHEPILWFNIIELTSCSTAPPTATPRPATPQRSCYTSSRRCRIQSLESPPSTFYMMTSRLHSYLAWSLPPPLGFEILSKEKLGNEKSSDLLRRMKKLPADKYESSIGKCSATFPINDCHHTFDNASSPSKARFHWTFLPGCRRTL